jgi:hypothetical protein
MHYLPLAPGFFPILVGFFLIVLVLRSVRYAYESLGVSSNTAIFLLFATLIGSIFNIPIAGTREARLPPRRSGGFSPSALIYPDFYLIIAWFAEHFIAFAFFDVPLPFLIWHAEHFRPKFTALGTHIWIHDEWDTALIIQRTFPLLSLFGS